jgi:hypothetical protein
MNLSYYSLKKGLKRFILQCFSIAVDQFYIIVYVIGLCGQIITKTDHHPGGFKHEI